MVVENFETKTKYPSVEYRRLMEYTLEILKATGSNKETIKKTEEQREKLIDNDFWLKLADYYVCEESEKLEKEPEKNIKAVQAMLEHPDEMFQAIYIDFSRNYHLGLYRKDK